MEAQTVTLLVQVGEALAPEIINLLHSKGATVSVPQTLQSDKEVIAEDLATLRGEAAGN